MDTSNDVNEIKQNEIYDKIVSLALENYDIDVTSFNYLDEHSNILYKVNSANDKYIMKVCRPIDHTKNELIDSAKWLSFIHENIDFNANKVIKTKNDEFICTIKTKGLQEGRNCLLFDWIEGNNLSENITVEYCYKWGELLAQIHNFSEKYQFIKNDLMIWNKAFYWDEEKLFDEKYSKYFTEERKNLYLKIKDIVNKAINYLFNNKPEPIIIHADLHPDNLIVNNNKIYAIDFEDVMWGYPVQDISISLLYIRNNENYKELRESFYNGYTSIREWPEDYKGQIETFFVARLLMFANYIAKFEEDQIENYFTRYDKAFSDFINEYFDK